MARSSAARPAQAVIGKVYDLRPKRCWSPFGRLPSLRPQRDTRAWRKSMLAAEGRVVMVSGASRGIGRAVTDRLTASGFTVSAGLRRPEQLPERERLMTHRYDAEEVGSAEAWVAATVARFGHI